MKHLSEDQLVLYHYHEAEDGEAIEGHLAACRSCRDSYQALQDVLAAVNTVQIPERGESYANEVWQRLRPRLAEPSRSSWAFFLPPRRWVPVAAVAALCLMAFLLGRFWPRPEVDIARQPISEQTRERILLVAVGDHLERSQMVLIELANAPKGQGKIDISPERERAQDLVEANRLYRQAAARAGETGMASVLDDLERALLEVAHSPSKLSSVELEEFRRRIEAQGILFKVRVIDEQVQERERADTEQRVHDRL